VVASRVMDAKKKFEGKHVIVLERRDWEFVERKKAREAVAVLALTDDDGLILTEQFRAPVNARVIDLPAGLIGDDGNHDPMATGMRELEEETGYTCASLEMLVKGPTSPGITSEIVHFYRARQVRQQGKGGGVGGEDIRVHVVPRRGIEVWLRQREKEGILLDLKLWVGLYFAAQST
jgi:ADP-ribose pyrophosphatase